ncbi:MAG: TonB-dependent receptor [Mediterranea sp.]|jgi:TonB-linked SusC/RagA family outer membrane protein|nr:TonB-dependent receptor [Mediterranea sp.]
MIKDCLSKGITLCCVLAIATGLHAQQTAVSGRVLAGNEPLPGASVTLKGKTAQGTITDADGNYHLQAERNATLLVSFVGYKTAQVPVNNRTTINIELEEDAKYLDEVEITVPYRTAKRSTFTGSAGYVGGDLIEKSQVSNVSKALQGTVAGLQSFSQSGQPGSDATIRIRGIGSINASSSPLYVVDGVPYDGSLSSIASADIESVTVLKDAASATLYGSRAANGVIMIKTRQGQANAKATVEFSAKYGLSDRARRDYDLLSTNDYFELYWEALRNYQVDQGKSAADAAAYASTSLAGTIRINPYGTANPQPVGADGQLKAGLTPLWDDNWTDILSQNAHYTDLNVRVSGGSASAKYYLSAGYLNDQGIIIESGFKRYTLRLNVESEIRKWLKVGLNTSGTHSVQDYPKQDDSISNNIVLFGRAMPSFYPVWQRDATTGDFLTNAETGERLIDYGAYRPTNLANANPAGSLSHDLSRISRDAVSIRGHVLITPLTDLTLRSSINIDYNSRFNHNYTNPTYGSGATTGGSVSKSNSRSTGVTFNNVLSYAKTLAEKHKINVLAGQEYYEYNTASFGGTREKVITDGYYEPDAASLLSDFYGNSDQYKLLSFFSNAEYAYDNRYFLSASVRSDGSSRFHPDNRWGTFWSVGASWRAVDEPFLEAAKEQGLSNLILRASYGAQGNDNIGYYAYQALYSIQNNLGEAGLRASRLATPDLSWETNLNLNIGIDFGLFNNRLSGSIEWFDRRSKDLLFSKNLVPSSGFSSTNQNIGSISNRGWELTVEGYPVSTRDWKWKLSLNATTYKNTITSLPSKEMWSGNKKWVEGGSIYDFYLVEWAGVNPDNGNPQWYKQGSNGEKTVTEDYSSASANTNKIKSGSSLPDLSGGFQSSLRHKGWELSTAFAYTLGGKIYNGDKIFLLHEGSAVGRTWSVDILKRWTPENTITDVPRLTTNPKSSWTNASTRFLTDRSYLRLKTLTLSYDLPKTLLATIGLSTANVFVQSENLLTWTKEQGLDPEQTFDGSTYYRYPAMKTISIGVNVKL